MVKGNVILTKTYSFSLDVIDVFRYLTEKKREYILSKQLLRSATSIGANAEEATAGVSRKEFIVKLQISYKEARETHYWLRLLRDSSILEKEKSEPLLLKCEEIIRILNAILQSSKE